MSERPAPRRPRVLCVDDEPNVLEGLVAFLRRRYKVFTAQNGAQGLIAVDQHGPFDVVVSDMRMPGMDGAAFLAEVRDLAPDTTRILLTGHAEMSAAIAAVNRGGVFRFLTKPCPPADLLRAVQEGCRQHELRRAERELLEETLKGSVGMLSEVMSLAAPHLFGTANRIQRTVRWVVVELGLEEPWKYELAAMLSQVGLVGLDEDLVIRAHAGRPLHRDEQHQIDSHPATAKRLLSRIPRLEEVAGMVANQRKNVSVAKAAQALHDKRADLIGGHILRAALDLDAAVQGGAKPLAAIEAMQEIEGVYNPRVLEAMLAVYQNRTPPTRHVTVGQLGVGMVLLEPIQTHGGVVVVPTGHEITATLRAGLMRFSEHRSLKEPVLVQLPDVDPDARLATAEELVSMR